MSKKSGTSESQLTLILGRQHSQNDCSSTQDGQQKCTRCVCYETVIFFFFLSFLHEMCFLIMGKVVIKIKPPSAEQKNLGFVVNFKVYLCCQVPGRDQMFDLLVKTPFCPCCTRGQVRKTRCLFLEGPTICMFVLLPVLSGAREGPGGGQDGFHGTREAARHHHPVSSHLHHVERPQHQHHRHTRSVHITIQPTVSLQVPCLDLFQF